MLIIFFLFLHRVFFRGRRASQDAGSLSRSADNIAPYQRLVILFILYSCKYHLKIINSYNLATLYYYFATVAKKANQTSQINNLGTDTFP